MKILKRGGSGNVIDRRGAGIGGGGMGLPIALGGGGIGTIILLALMLLGGGLGGGLNGLNGGGSTDTAGDEERAELVEFVLDDAQEFWTGKFREDGRTYDEAELVLFTQATQTGCGTGSAQTGPFYCPPDERVYIDLSFFDELERRFGAPGDFAQAYVIAHEIGHHVQNLLGTNDEVQRLSQANPDRANELSVKMELQADCYAGVWGFSAAQRGILEPGDLEEGLGAASAVGDDRIQKESGARVNPETWTHGSSEQRMEWFRKGFDTGDPNACNTFG